MTACITAEETRERVRAALDLTDSGLAALCETPTDGAGNIGHQWNAVAW